MDSRWFTTMAATLTILATISIKQCLAIKCWECRSDADNKCADPFDNSTYFFTDCDRQTMMHIHTVPQMCRKIRQKVNGQWRYIRSCAWLSTPDKMARTGDERYCLIRSGTWDIHIEYCECWSKDGCNGADMVKWTRSWPLFLITLLLTSMPFARTWIS